VRDGWTIGFTPRIAAAVWVGNTDPTPVNEGMSGYRMASPIWSDFMRTYLAGREAVDFVRPGDVVQQEICATSGLLAGADCAERISELFASDQLPPAEQEGGFIQRVPVDLWTGLVANEYCNESVYEARFVNLLVNAREDVVAREIGNARRWIEETAAGRAWAQSLGIEVPLALPPTEECRADTARPQVAITVPQGGREVEGNVTVLGTARGPGFNGYQLEYGLSHDPGGWAPAAPRGTQPVENGELGVWDSASVSFGGPITLRVLLFGPDNPYTEGFDPVTREARVLLTLLEPTATPTPTATTTPTATATSTVTPTPTTTGTPESTPTPVGATETVISSTPIPVTLPAPAP
jgi:membrane peptidoglycan carboxypeptidase